MSLDATIRRIVGEEFAKFTGRLPADVNQDQFLTTKEVARMAKLSIGYFESGRSTGRKDLPPYHKVGRRVLYRHSDVVVWLSERRRGDK